MTSFLDQLTSKMIAHPLMDWMAGQREGFDSPTFKKVTTVFFVRHSSASFDATTAWEALQALQSVYNSDNFVLLDVNYETGPVPIVLASVIGAARSIPAALFVQYDGKIYQQSTPLTADNIATFLDGFRS